MREPLRRAAALCAGIAATAAWAEVHRPHELEASREHNTARDACDSNETVLKRLAQRLECVTTELGELVKKQDAAVREARLPRSQVRAAADDRRGRRAVMRCAERRRRDERMITIDETGDRVDARHLERAVAIEGRQDAR